MKRKKKLFTPNRFHCLSHCLIRCRLEYANLNDLNDVMRYGTAEMVTWILIVNHFDCVIANRIFLSHYENDLIHFGYGCYVFARHYDFDYYAFPSHWHCDCDYENLTCFVIVRFQHFENVLQKLILI